MASMNSETVKTAEVILNGKEKKTQATVAKQADKTKKAVKKTQRKSTKRTPTKEAVFIEYEKEQFEITKIKAAVKKAWTNSGRLVKEYEDVKIYIKPEDAKAYYVINEGELSGCLDL